MFKIGWINLKTSKTVVVPLIVILVLGVSGLTVAQWTETLLIDENVETGELKVGFRWYGGWEFSKHVTLTPRLKYWRPPGVTSHTFTLTGVYPGYGSGGLTQLFWVAYAIRNEGTIPAEVESIRIDAPDWIEVWTLGCNVPEDIKEELRPQIQGDTGLTAGEKQGLLDVLDEDVEVGDILYPGPWWKGNTWGFLVVRLHILENAPENSPGTVTVTLVFKQWNR